MFRLFRRRRRSKNIAVYHLSTFDNGHATAKPIGVAPRLSDAYEKHIRSKHRPKRQCFLNETIDGINVVLFWSAGKKIEAVCFLTAEDALRFRGFVPFPDDALGLVLNHFPTLVQVQYMDESGEVTNFIPLPID